jgi:cytosine/adenosine deaminase-related metal-dependent hydrolase
MVESMIHPATLLKSKWILPIESEPIENGSLLVADGKIEGIFEDGKHPASATARANVVDYGNAVLLPGFINLHTHIEYSYLRGLNANRGLFAWMRALMERSFAFKPADFESASQLGLREAARTGTTCLVDSSYAGTAAKAIAQAGLRGIVGLELFGVNEEAVETDWSNWLAKFDRVQNTSDPTLAAALKNGTVQLTVAPHAPYTVCPLLWRKAREWANSRHTLLLSHLAESDHECQFLKSSDEVVDEHLRFAFGRANYTGDPVKSAASWKGQGLTPVQHLKKNSLLDSNFLAAHAVKIDNADVKDLFEADVAVAHCPRSNARLCNGRLPIELLTAAGIRYGLGTDSLASTDNLDLLDEARFALDLHRAVHPNEKLGFEWAVKRITLDAARCLKLESRIGSLKAGKDADLAVFRLPSWHRQETDPYALLVTGQCRILDLYVGGAPVLEKLQAGSLKP